MDSKIAYEYLTGKRVFDKESALKTALKGAEEGIVLLENKDRVLPIGKLSKIAVFGRMQKNYMMLGTGSGGRVTPPFVTDIFGSLCELGLKPDSIVESFYDEYVATHPYDPGNGWTHPASQTEPELEPGFVAEAARRADIALVIITRTAGEDRDYKNEPGEYLLSATELGNLKLLRKKFNKLVVILNVSGIIDCSGVLSCSPDGLLLVWTGGMMGGLAAARVLTGESEPGGRLPDTVAYSREDYPAYGNFGAAGRNIYREDIFVGYRYFGTFARDKVVYPFGYGLSYTRFETSFVGAEPDLSDGSTVIRVSVKNTGDRAGSEVVQCYVSAPDGRLGKPFRVLVGFKRTKVLEKGESCEVELVIDVKKIASFDDTDPDGNGRNWVVEPGAYIFSVGKNSRDASDVYTRVFDKETVIEHGVSALAPVTPFERMVNNKGEIAYEQVNLRVSSDDPIPGEFRRPKRSDITFDEVADGKAGLEDFVAQLTDTELMTLVRGEGMSSPKVTPGTAAAFVGTTPELRSRGLPVLCCTDGPAGIRMVSEAQCIAYPSATCLAATWDEPLVEEMYHFCGAELASYCVDILLGPGTNIHRDPLCGRNFEYFSEDPLLAGKMAAAVCRGLDSAGVSGAVKHFMANNQETDRHGADSVLSERAIREIYSRPFAICVSESEVGSVMTSYNPVNGRWTASNYDLTTKLLREAFGFKGFVMTDWWARVSNDDGTPGTTNLAAMVHAGNDIYMVCPDALTRDDNLASALAEGTLARSELQRCAYNLCAFALKSLSYRAQRAGYGVRDLKAECAGKTPKAVRPVEGGVAVYNSDIACKAVVEFSFVSNTPELTQTNVSLNINEKNAGGFIIGGTGGKEISDYREISLVKGENKFIFTAENSEASAVRIKVF